jgi:hypothetical protein
MTEEEWLAEPWPLWMVFDPICRSSRKRRLFVVACIRRFPQLLKDKTLKNSLQWAEAYVDDAADESSSMKLYRKASAGSELSLQLARALLEPRFGKYVMAIEDLFAELGHRQDRRSDPAVAREKEAQKEIVFEIFGNPFHPITPSLNLFTWNDVAIPQIAEAIYEERRFGDMSILADALEDAGCEPALVEHCRNEQPHVRGCWVIDLLLGKK